MRYTTISTSLKNKYMAKYSVKLKKRELVADNTMAFYLEKPEGFGFRAGQHIVVSLIDPPATDEKGNNRVFSVASAPWEEDLMVATRMRETAFKENIKALPLGSAVRIDGPFGFFTLHKDSSRPAVFLVGGIGVTPFRSMVLDSVKQQLPYTIYLFYSNRRPEDAAFLRELTTLSAESPNYNFIGTMSDMEKSAEGWDGERGYIDMNMISKYVPDITQPVYYTAGPSPMVKAMREMLAKAGVGKDDLRTEEFPGY